MLLGDPIAPGGEGLVQLVLDRPIAAAAGDRFVIRDTSAQRTIGGGAFLDLRAPARRRRTPERLAQLAAHAIPDPEAALAALLARPPHHLDPDAFARDRGLAPDDIRRPPRHRAHREPRRSARPVARHRRPPRARARRDARGLPRREPRPRRHRHGAPAHVARAAPAGAGLPGAAAGRGARRAAGARRRLGAARRPRGAAVARGRGPLGGGAAAARRRHALPPAAGARPRRRARPRRGRGPPPLQAPRPHGPRARGRARPFLPARHRRRDGRRSPPSSTPPSACSAAAQFRDRLDNGRKVAIQILEFLDRHGVTMRRGDLRRDQRPAARPVSRATTLRTQGGEASPVGRPDFKSGRGRETVLGGFDSHSLPPLEPGTA